MIPPASVNAFVQEFKDTFDGEFDVECQEKQASIISIDHDYEVRVFQSQDGFVCKIRSMHLDVWVSSYGFPYTDGIDLIMEMIDECTNAIKLIGLLHELRIKFGRFNLSFPKQMKAEVHFQCPNVVAGDLTVSKDGFVWHPEGQDNTNAVDLADVAAVIDLIEDLGR